MRRYSPAYYTPTRRGYRGRPRSPPRRGYDADRARHKEQNHGSLLVRNIPLDCRPEELRVPFERFGLVRDVYLPKDYYTGEPRGFAFVQFVDADDAAEAQYHMNGQIFAGRQITVVVAAETRKRPEEMRRKTRPRGPSGYGGKRSSYYGRSRSRSRSPCYAFGSRSLHQSSSYSPEPRGRHDYSISPARRHLGYPRSPRELDVNPNRSYSPHYGFAEPDGSNYCRSVYTSMVFFALSRPGQSPIGREVPWYQPRALPANTKVLSTPVPA